MSEDKPKTTKATEASSTESTEKKAPAKKPAAKKPAAAAAAKKPQAKAKSTGRSSDRTAEIGLHNLAPAEGSRRPRKRIGRGHGSGTGKTSGRGHKGYGSRSGAKQRARFEGGQNPIHMRMRKLRGPNKKMSMPFEPFRTHTQPVNLADLEARFDANAKVDLKALESAGLAKRQGTPVKILARGELKKALTVEAHAFSKAAQEKIEASGGSCVVISQ
jgi:large subunit ribosomal protein L15